MHELSRPRLLIQYLEPSPAVEKASPERLRDHLASAFEILPVTDLALGWRLREAVVKACRSVVPSEVTLWRWVPVFTDSGEGRPTDAFAAVGPDGATPPPFRDMADFRFLCLDHDEVIETGLARALRLGGEIDAEGVLLDRIRWHSPSASPAAGLTCFCERSRAAAARDGLDLGAVAAEVRAAPETLRGRRKMVAALLGGDRSETLDAFMTWRAQTVTRAVGRLASGLREAGLASALDVFTPALTGSVGQDLGALAGSGEWAKSMTYFDALGPASMPFELRGYGRWLEAAGETDAAGFIGELLGFDPPGLGLPDAGLKALRLECSRLSSAVGPYRSVAGIDAVEIPGVCEVSDSDLGDRVTAIRESGLGLAPCWELLLIGEERIGRIASAWEEPSAEGR